MTTLMKREQFEDSSLMFIGETFVGTAANIEQLKPHGVSIVAHEGVALAYRDGTFYSLCGSSPKAFSVGTRCTKRDLHYVPETKMEYLESLASRYSMLMPIRDDKIVTASGIRQFVPGRGEWTARTEGDALEMAIAFSRESESVAMARAIAYNSGHSNILLSYRTTPINNAVHHVSKRISLFYEAGLVIADRAAQQTLDSYGISDGTEVCIRYKASKAIGRYLAVRGELDSYFTQKTHEVNVSTPITLTLPADYPVFVG